MNPVENEVVAKLDRSNAPQPRSRREIEPVDDAARAAATERLDRMTKPRGSLGAVEDLAITLAGIAGACPPPLP